MLGNIWEIIGSGWPNSIGAITSIAGLLVSGLGLIWVILAKRAALSAKDYSEKIQARISNYDTGVELNRTIGMIREIRNILVTLGDENSDSKLSWAHVRYMCDLVQSQICNINSKDSNFDDDQRTTLTACNTTIVETEKRISRALFNRKIPNKTTAHTGLTSLLNKLTMLAGETRPSGASTND